jgi:FMN phosphatase YigB (HAD superfamily)
MPCLVLDAMGVIFEAADDVAELLIPFIAEKSTACDEAIIQAAYLDVSLGTIDPDKFWNLVGVPADLEDEFLSRHSINDGVVELLGWANNNNIPVWCLSNDVGRWSLKLRERLKVETYLRGSIISGDIGMRKPDPGIYKALVQATGYPIDSLLFIDDRQKNVLAARALGIESIWYDPGTGFDAARGWIEKRLV